MSRFIDTIMPYEKAEGEGVWRGVSVPETLPEPKAERVEICASLRAGDA